VPESQLPNTVTVGRRAVTLPLYPEMTSSDQDFVVQTLDTLVRQSGS
jgi:dTDP-4-amino-4,6-dideoxygalactose transaminase